MITHGYLKYLFLPVLAATLISGCSLKDEKITDQAGTVSVVRPSYWIEINALNDDAIIQIANPFSEAYFIVIAEPRSDFPENYTLKQYSELTRSIIKESTKNYTDQHDDSLASINGMTTIKYIIDANVDGIDIQYWHISVASKSNFYQLIPWSLPEKIPDNKDNFMKVVKSFRETEKKTNL